MSGIGILILAAGASIRLGQPKQLLHSRGKPLIRQMAEVAIQSGCHPIGIVLGAYTETIAPHLANLNIKIIHNEQWQTGMASSIRCGLEEMAAIVPELDAIVLMVCDQPFVTPNLIRHLINKHRTTNFPIVVSAYGEVLGVPALFHKTLFPELKTLQGDVGAKFIIRQYRSRVLSIPFVEGAIDLDIPQDLKILASLT